MTKTTLHSYLKKAGLVAVLAITAGAFSAFAQYTQTFTEPASTAPSSSIATLLNIGATSQTMAGSLWAAAIGANTYSVNGYAWDLESNLTTLHIQQLCVYGSGCITSFPAASSLPVSVPATGSTCGGGWCWPNAFTAAKVCLMAGYTHLIGEAQGGLGGNVCNWQQGTNSWSCDSSCTTSCSSRTLTEVFCDNNGTSRLQ